MWFDCYVAIDIFSRYVVGWMVATTETHSRPHVSNDNPYSEAVNKTLKYCPAFPARFGPQRHRPRDPRPSGSDPRHRLRRQPHRFCGRRPTPPKLPTVAWINNPTIHTDAQKQS